MSISPNEARQIQIERLDVLVASIFPAADKHFECKLSDGLAGGLAGMITKEIPYELPRR